MNYKLLELAINGLDNINDRYDVADASLEQIKVFGKRGWFDHLYILKNIKYNYEQNSFEYIMYFNKNEIMLGIAEYKFDDNGYMYWECRMYDITDRYKEV